MHPTPKLTFILLALLTACGRPEATSKLLSESDGGGSPFSVSIDTDGNFHTSIETEVHAFADRFDTRPGRSADRETHTLGDYWHSFRSLFDGDGKSLAPGPGPTAVEKRRPLDREGSEHLSFSDASLPKATRSGSATDHVETYRSLDAARSAFEQQLSQAHAAAEAVNQEGSGGALALAGLINDAALAHNAQVQVVTASLSDLEAAYAALPKDAFKTPAATTQGQKLRSLDAYIGYADQRIAATASVNKKQLIVMAKTAMAAADQSYAAGDSEGGDIMVEVAYAALDAGLSFVPGVNVAKDAYEALTGFSLVTGRQLDALGRGAAILGVVTAGVFSEAHVAERIIEAFEHVASRASLDVARSTVKTARAAGVADGFSVMGAAEENALLITKGYSNPFKEGSIVVRGKSSGGSFVRYGGSDAKPGPWLTLESETRGLTPEEIQQKLALPSVPTTVMDVNVPAGTEISVGIAGPQSTWTGSPQGGGAQVFLETHVPDSAFQNMRPL